MRERREEASKRLDIQDTDVDEKLENQYLYPFGCAYTAQQHNIYELCSTVCSLFFYSIFGVWGMVVDGEM